MSFEHDLIVLIPGGELGYTEFWMRLIHPASPLHKDFGQLAQRGRVLPIAGPYTHSNVYNLVQQALEIPGWKRALVLEHDHEFPAEVFRRHAAYKEPIVAGLYVLRDITEPLPVIYRWDGARHNAEPYDAVELKRMLNERGLHEVDVVPLGCTSIRRDVLETWPEDKPIFSSYTNPRGKVISHDVWFCRLAQDNGWPIHVDTSLRIQHYAKVPVDDSYFLRWWDEIGWKAAAERQGLEVVDGNG